MSRYVMAIVMVLSSVLWGADNGEALYQAGRYDEAQTHYQRLLSQHPHQPELMYNLGSVYAKKGELGKAIVMLRRAQRVDPRDRDTRTNIAVLNKQVLANPTDEAALFDRGRHMILSYLTVVEWVNMSLLALAIFLIWPWLQRCHPRLVLGRSYRIGWGILTLVLLAMTIGSIHDEVLTPKGVIILTKAEVKSGPASTLDTIFYIHEGVQFTITKRVNEWSEVRLPNGLVGWVNTTNYWEI